MGRVYHCRDTELDVEVAVKVLEPELAADEAALRRVRREARLAARLRDGPGILSLYSFERHGDSFYLVMEYAPGGSLETRLAREKRLAEKECRRIGAEVVEALGYAHARGVLHRDIKPPNILFGADGRARIADFGLARILFPSAGPQAITVAGTPAYMAPEIAGRAEADSRADLFSLGCVLFEMATGERPYGGPFPLPWNESDPLGTPSPDPRSRRPGLTESFARVVRRLLATDPARRFPDGRSVAAALREDGDER